MLRLDAKVAMRCNFGELITEKRESIIRNSKVIAKGLDFFWTEYDANFMQYPPKMGQ